MKVKLTVAGALFFAVVLSGCGSSNATKPTATTAPSPTAAATTAPTTAPTSSTGTGTGTGTGINSALCTDINGAKIWVNNLKSLGNNPSVSALSNDLKKLEPKIAQAKSKASATLQKGFAGVETADTTLQKSITTLQQNSSIPVSTYATAIKDGVAAVATGYSTLVALTGCV
ncbi:MAG TPA: hypothetical protein VG815_15335 [Chloroflexota bacterium]|nr:hypothetical protein [Chloroflexota bacterium]